MNADRNWFFTVLALIATGLLLLLGTVWLSMERTNLAYGIEKLEKQITEERQLIAKLEVERDNLFSPYQLERLAKRHGLGPAAPGQIRRMDEPAQPEANKGVTELP
ncbi:MAG: hypothetical protein KKB70_11935 [Proteobacteria bacterium]|nr:hypothetical protein [Pseudomonadota bacterium]MBU1610804.1 hypothetical protein [Pseudomonadota bacterium]